jgi:hypothetical protein
MKIRIVFEGTPRCANSTAEYEEWRHFSRFQFLPSGFCTDCTPEYKQKMMLEGRCDYPEIQFYENDGYLPEDYNDEPKKKELDPHKALPRKPPLLRGHMQGMKMEQLARRPGSLDILKNPSRLANTLYYPDGRVEKVLDDSRISK